MRLIRFLSTVFVLSLVTTSPGRGAFHLMQIEHAIGGVCADTTAQAVQLRMRAAGQNFVMGHDLRAYDAAGANAVVLVAFGANVTTGTLGSRILITSPGFQAKFGGPTPDFVMTNIIPQSYLPAGKLTFESPVLWALAWGGAGYTGTNTGTTDNDADGNFNPPFANLLPWTGDQSLQFQGTASAMSTNNAADYALSASPVTLTNNAGAAAPLVSCVFGDGFESGDTGGWSGVSP